MSNFVERESLENYLETVLILAKKHERVRAVDVATLLNVSRASVSRAIGNLRACGYLTDDINLCLTKEGIDAAEEVVRRHEILSKYFAVVSGVNVDVAEHCACRVEHVISRETSQGIKNFLEQKGIKLEVDPEIETYLPVADERIESGEDYLEAIYKLIKQSEIIRAADVSRELNLSRASVSRGLGVLREKGFIEVSVLGQVTLTQEGCKIAEKVCEKHEAMSELLMLTAGVSAEIAGREACRIEHMIGDELYVGIRRYLDENGSSK